MVKKPALTDVDLERRFAITVKNAIASGLTSIHDAGFDPISLQFFKRFALCLSSGCSVNYGSGKPKLASSPYVLAHDADFVVLIC